MRKVMREGDLTGRVDLPSLADRLLVHAHSDPSFRTLALDLRLSGEPSLIQGIPVDETNLVLRAASVLAERCGVRGFAEIELEKAIPHAAGLGALPAGQPSASRQRPGGWRTGPAWPVRDLAPALAAG